MKERLHGEEDLKLIWSTEIVKISHLNEFENNPRCISKKAFEDLKDSLNHFNYVELIAIDTDGTILAGHMRVKAMTALGFDEIEVRVSNRKLTDKERREYVIRSNKNTGDWDDDCLANEWEPIELIEYGFTQEELGIVSEKKKGKTKVTFEFEDPAHLENCMHDLNEIAGVWGVKVTVKLPK